MHCRYVHDDSETTEDQVDLLVTDGVNTAEASLKIQVASTFLHLSSIHISSIRLYVHLSSINLSINRSSIHLSIYLFIEYH